MVKDVSRHCYNQNGVGCKAIYLSFPFQRGGLILGWNPGLSVFAFVWIGVRCWLQWEESRINPQDSDNQSKMPQLRRMTRPHSSRIFVGEIRLSTLPPLLSCAPKGNASYGLMWCWLVLPSKTSSTGRPSTVPRSLWSILLFVKRKLRAAFRIKVAEVYLTPRRQGSILELQWFGCCSCRPSIWSYDVSLFSGEVLIALQNLMAFPT